MIEYTMKDIRPVDVSASVDIMTQLIDQISHFDWFIFLNSSSLWASFFLFSWWLRRWKDDASSESFRFFLLLRKKLTRVFSNVALFLFLFLFLVCASTSGWLLLNYEEKNRGRAREEEEEEEKNRDRIQRTREEKQNAVRSRIVMMKKSATVSYTLMWDAVWVC